MTRRTFLGGSLAAAGSLSYARWLEPKWVSITSIKKAVHFLPAPLRVVHLTDLHFIPGRDERWLREAVAMSNRMKPDLVLITGDFLDHQWSTLSPLLQELKGLQARLGIYGCPGNHDVWIRAGEALRNPLRSAGIELLRNQLTRVADRGAHLTLAGVDSCWGGSPEVDRTIRQGAGHVALFLAHEPVIWDRVRGHIGMQFSGHTHGGQCAVPWLGWAPVVPRFGRPYVYGHFADPQNHSQLFVSRGLGTTGIPVRFGCPPEVVVMDLIPA